ncbi:hypothetical protein AtDm6_1707 [Acetobacter tropicalis]|uniref:Uncharacterized protein n=1 Tax=Acetobacter tropicalis TaxID=104102 RepID=A0A094YPK5_9PROT|nr:hypothetical protein AtDm6_1707 [Acetobacter tropicalis]
MVLPLRTGNRKQSCQHGSRRLCLHALEECTAVRQTPYPVVADELF